MINDIAINEIVVSNRLPFNKQDFKYFIVSKDNKASGPLCIFFPEMSVYKTYSDKTEWMYFIIKDKKLSDRYLKF